MHSDQFWHSQDGQILALRKNNDALSLTLAFKLRSPAELDFIRSQLGALHFTERSSLARIGIEMVTAAAPIIEGNKVLLEANAFIFDKRFPAPPTSRNSCARVRPSAGYSTPRSRPSSPPTRSGRR